MTGTIIYPFKQNKNFHFGYIWTLELARLINFNLIIFTTVDEKTFEKSKEEVYHELLGAQVHYWQQYHLEHRKLKYKRKKRIIIEPVPKNDKKGFYESFTSQIANKKYSIAVIQPDIFEDEQIEYWSNTLKKSVVILPFPSTLLRENNDEDSLNSSERFYEIFRKSELHNLDPHIINSLAKDKGLFNYLRHFFTRK